MHLAGIPNVKHQKDYVVCWNSIQQNLRSSEFRITCDLQYGGYQFSNNWVKTWEYDFKEILILFRELKSLFADPDFTLPKLHLLQISENNNMYPFQLLLSLLDAGFGCDSGIGPQINLACGSQFAQIVYNDFLTYQTLIRSELEINWRIYNLLAECFRLASQDGMVCFFSNSSIIS